MNQDTPTKTKKSRRTAALWGSGAIAATVLVLGVNGTLSSWTSALITNSNDTAGATASYLALVETDNTNTCDTTTAPNNTIAACSSINKYGGNTTMSPGDSSVVSVTFTNPGTAVGNTFAYTPGTCTPTNGTGGIDLCSQGDLTVAVACSTGTSYNAGNDIAALGQSAAAPGSLVAKTWTSAPALDAASATAITCRFTTTLDAASPPVDAGSQVSQPIAWQLDAV
ncbi:hypothetical protein [Nocardioides marmorisolisilvae]|uniref:SipW-cognate class signal peptide n=1 Tax=Nocardioides marmorisolisilvae TaxID=1542737 RepID=A0A3N0DUM4_9ACTN|nr:hypothetical protein [Nocardioides marmorisolisilvae]RNL79186.1 hypothetical protein EFL95_09160 [Nocardioides marmorisolisilvae]